MNESPLFGCVTAEDKAVWQFPGPTEGIVRLPPSAHKGEAGQSARRARTCLVAGGSDGLPGSDRFIAGKDGALDDVDFKVVSEASELP